MKSKVVKKSIEKFLQFNGKKIAILLSNGTWYIAIKPICEALNVEYTRAFKNIKEDAVLSQLLAEQPTVAADSKLRNMACLPERYIYGWLFSVRSESPELLEYKKKCYDILYEHFHSPLTERVNALMQQRDNNLRILELKEALDVKVKESEEFKEIKELKGLKKKIAQSLKESDTNLLDNQISFSFE
jgi:hypothetical protein